jgi:hypothetical protein
MRKPFSLIACFLVLLFAVQHRVRHISLREREELKVTDWDCLGYYMYLPGVFIYHDIKKLEWLPGIEDKYKMIGSWFYQASKIENGNFVGKYLIGVSIMQAPFFFVAHSIAIVSHQNADGFSPPYQWAVAFAALFYTLVAVFLLRKFLLNYFTDKVVGISLLLLCLATNFIQYAAIDAGLSHAYIFLLYTLLLIATRNWHLAPSWFTAFAIGFIIGLAIVCRPTEAVMLFIPLMWDMENRESSRIKWQKVRYYSWHLIILGLAVFIAFIPQLIYWKYVSGSYFYELGSSWDFLNPHLEVLVGWEKGWFIYTPVCILFVVGMYFIDKMPFRMSVYWFCLLNVYIIISWRAFNYAGSYSARALMQSYPVFALPLTAFNAYILSKKWRGLFYLVSAYLIALNAFQLEQYHKTILHYSDMNKAYYSRIYWNFHPNALDMSVMDKNEFLNDTNGYDEKILWQQNGIEKFKAEFPAEKKLLSIPLEIKPQNTWILIRATIKATEGYWGSYLNASLQYDTIAQHGGVRFFNPLAKESKHNNYAFYMQVNNRVKNAVLNIYLSGDCNIAGEVRNLCITLLTKK